MVVLLYSFFLQTFWFSSACLFFSSLTLLNGMFSMSRKTFRSRRASLSLVVTLKGFKQTSRTYVLLKKVCFYFYIHLSIIHPSIHLCLVFSIYAWYLVLSIKFSIYLICAWENDLLMIKVYSVGEFLIKFFPFTLIKPV